MARLPMASLTGPISSTPAIQMYTPCSSKSIAVGNRLTPVPLGLISGKTLNRPGLAAMLDHARPIDTLAVIWLDHPGRSLKELLERVKDNSEMAYLGTQPRLR